MWRHDQADDWQPMCRDLNGRIVRPGKRIDDPNRKRRRRRSHVQPKLPGNVMLEQDRLGRVLSSGGPVVVGRLDEPVGNITVAARH